MTTDSANRVYNRAEIFALAWMFVRMNGFTRAEALKCAWANAKVRREMINGIANFRFVKVDGTIRQASGTLKGDIIPATSEENRKHNPRIQVFFDTEKQEWRCFKKCNLL